MKKTEQNEKNKNKNTRQDNVWECIRRRTHSKIVIGRSTIGNLLIKSAQNTDNTCLNAYQEKRYLNPFCILKYRSSMTKYQKSVYLFVMSSASQQLPIWRKVTAGNFAASGPYATNFTKGKTWIEKCGHGLIRMNNNFSNFLRVQMQSYINKVTFRRLLSLLTRTLLQCPI